MEKKTVTMDYLEHETLLGRIKLFEESKLCTLRIIGEYPRGNGYERVRFSINSKEELSVAVKQIVDEEIEGITAPGKERIKELNTRIFNLEFELEKHKKFDSNKTFFEKLNPCLEISEMNLITLDFAYDWWQYQNYYFMSFGTSSENFWDFCIRIKKFGYKII